MLALDGNDGLKSFQGLDRSLEADDADRWRVSQRFGP